MSKFKLVFDVCIQLLNTRLTFSPYSFTILQALISLAVLSIISFFVNKLFE